MVAPGESPLPAAQDDERQLYLDWLRYLRGAVLRNLDGLDDEQARWHPEGGLLSLLGIVSHLTNVEWRWIDGGMLGHTVARHESEFHPGPERRLSDAVADYRARQIATEEAVRTLGLDTPCGRGDGVDLRWVLLHLINETARHAGHADATRELLDGTKGE